MVATSVSMVVQFKPIKKTAITSKKEKRLRCPTSGVLGPHHHCGTTWKARRWSWKKTPQKGINIRFTMDLADLVILLSTTKLLDRTLVANLGVPAMDHDGQSWYTHISFFGYLPPLQYFLDLHFCWCHPLVWCHQHPCPPHPHAATVLARHALRLPMFQGPRGIIDLRQCTAKVWNRVRCRIPAI